MSEEAPGAASEPGDELFLRSAGQVLAPSRRRLRFVQQLDSTDCGPSCLAMVLDHYRRSASRSWLRDLCFVSRQGCSLFAISEAAESFGFQTRGVEIEFDQLSEVLLPAVAHVGTNHFVVVLRANEREVVIADPARRILKQTRAVFSEDWRGSLLLLRPTEEFVAGKGREPDPKLGRFLSYLQPQRVALVKVLLLAIALQVTGLVTPLITQAVIDRVLIGREIGLLEALLGALAGAAVLLAGLSALKRLVLFQAVRSIDRTIVVDFHRRLFQLPLGFFASRKVGDLLLRFSDNHKIRHFLTSVVFGAALDLVLGVTYLVVVFLYDYQLALVGLLPLPLLFLLGWIVTPSLRRNRRELAELRSRKQSALVEGLNAVTTIKSMCGERAEGERYAQLFDDQLEIELKGVRLTTTSKALTTIITTLSMALLLYVGAQRVLAAAVTVGGLVAVLALLGQVIGPAKRLVRVWERLQDTSVALERVAEIFDRTPEEPPDLPRKDLPPLEGHVRLEDVTFRYAPDLEPALRGVSLEVLPGQMVAIVGRSGAGKSTLANLLLKFWSPESGAVYLDGIDLREVSVRSLRHQVGYVPQKIDLFSGSIRENIDFGRNLEPEAIRWAARTSGADAFISRRPDGYETLVGERSTARFSGGELQRLAVARTLAGRPSLLVLDEPTSALDRETEETLIENFVEAVAGGTIIVLAHRLSFTRRADQVFVLDQGTLVEKGTHDELFALGGVYSRLFSEKNA
ncbi:MAG: peptidase domain-containing ABC transporter [Planctomycetes bacterium]|nr:peptidase domain-containing ABC transporter [Planctomycetota bacterium]